jgi:hypothetical protein
MFGLIQHIDNLYIRVYMYVCMYVFVYFLQIYNLLYKYKIISIFYLLKLLLHTWPYGTGL